MSKFTGPLRLDFGDWTDTGNGRIAILLEPLVWECDERGSGLTVTVPAGYMSDGASVPRILWPLLPPWGDRATRAAILHDFICGELDEGRALPGAETRPACDWQFYLALLALDVAEWRATICWLGVRLGSLLPSPTGKGHLRHP